MTTHGQIEQFEAAAECVESAISNMARAWAQVSHPDNLHIDGHLTPELVRLEAAVQTLIALTRQIARPDYIPF